MAENQPQNKEQRHQRAKQKHEHYQKVVSCQNLIHVSFLLTLETFPLLPIPWTIFNQDWE